MTEREVANTLYPQGRRAVQGAPLAPPIPQTSTPKPVQGSGVATNEPVGGTVDRDEG